MSQTPLVTDILNSLQIEGYSVLPMGLYDPKYWIKSCFDIAARKEFLLMIKIFLNIDKIPSDLIEDLKLISYFFNGTPLIIGNETRKVVLRDEVVYERRGIPAVNLYTFKHLIKDDKIYVISRKGGFYVKVDSEKIHRLRLEQELSLQDIASKIGVSRKAAYLFERMNQIKEKNAGKLEEVFDESVKFPIDIFNWAIEKEEFHPSMEETDFQAEIKELFEELGYDIYWAKKAPFDGITSEIEESKSRPEEKCLITDLSLSRKRRIYNRLQMISEISKFARKLSMFIIEDEKLPRIDNVLILQKAILEKMNDIKELYEVLKKVKRTFY
ncbi:MAG: hypothetical protein HWN66_02650 [Candidatus Helarchaeota archaeon]|nr:hypothetical protein [Candidatus Helarchaeota archaeon]